jgi:hypothetical protein
VDGVDQAEAKGEEDRFVAAEKEEEAAAAEAAATAAKADPQASERRARRPARSQVTSFSSEDEGISDFSTISLVFAVLV